MLTGPSPHAPGRWPFLGLGLLLSLGTYAPFQGLLEIEVLRCKIVWLIHRVWTRQSPPIGVLQCVLSSSYQVGHGSQDLATVQIPGTFLQPQGFSLDAESDEDA